MYWVVEILSAPTLVEIVSQQSDYTIELVLNPTLKFYNEDEILFCSDIKYSSTKYLSTKLDEIDLAITTGDILKKITFTNKTITFSQVIDAKTKIFNIDIENGNTIIDGDIGRTFKNSTVLYYTFTTGKLNIGTTPSGTDIMEDLNVTGAVNIYMLYAPNWLN
jgi:hypothetical protein